MHRKESTRRIREVGKAAGLPDEILDTAVDVYGQALDAGYQPAGARVYPAATYAAARIRDHPIKPKELAPHAPDGVDAGDIVTGMRRIVDALPVDVGLQDPAAYVDRYVDELDGSDELREAARELCATGTENGLNSGKSPSGFAAACVYAATHVVGDGPRQEEVADVADVSTVTIRNMYPDIIRASGGIAPRIDGRSVPRVADGGSDAIGQAIDDIFGSFDAAPGVVKTDAHQMTDGLDDAEWVRNKNPRGVAAGLLYVAADQNRVKLSQSELAEKAGVHKETILHRVRDIRDYYDIGGGDGA